MILLFLLICLLHSCQAHTKDDPILTLVRSQHVLAETVWTELPLDQVPQYMTPKQLIFHTIVPNYNENITTDYRINPNHDLKVSFMFDHYQKLTTPWITVFDSIGRRSLKKLEITFVHDEFEILKVIYTPTYGSQLKRIDPTHPTLRGFELIYSWENAETEDLTYGMQVLFLSVMIGVMGIVAMMIFAVEFDYQVDSSSNSSSNTNFTPSLRSDSQEKIRNSPSMSRNKVYRK